MEFEPGLERSQDFGSWHLFLFLLYVHVTLFMPLFPFSPDEQGPHFIQ